MISRNIFVMSSKYPLHHFLAFSESNFEVLEIYPPCFVSYYRNFLVYYHLYYSSDMQSCIDKDIDFLKNFESKICVIYPTLSVIFELCFKDKFCDISVSHIIKRFRNRYFLQYTLKAVNITRRVHFYR